MLTSLRSDRGQLSKLPGLREPMTPLPFVSPFSSWREKVCVQDCDMSDFGAEIKRRLSASFGYVEISLYDVQR